MALPKPIAQLVQEVFQTYGQDVDEATKDPEVYLASLLLSIKRELPVTGCTLKTAVEIATFRKRLERARQRLEEPAAKQ